MKRSEEIENQIKKLGLQLEIEKQKERMAKYDQLMTVNYLLGQFTEYLKNLDDTDKSRESRYFTDQQEAENCIPNFINFVADNMTFDQPKLNQKELSQDEVDEFTLGKWVDFDWDLYSLNPKSYEVKYKRGESKIIDIIYSEINSRNNNNQQITVTSESTGQTRHFKNGKFEIDSKESHYDLLMRDKKVAEFSPKYFSERDKVLFARNEWIEFDYDLYKKYKKYCKLKYRMDNRVIKRIEKTIEEKYPIVSTDTNGDRSTHTINGRNVIGENHFLDILMKINLPF